ncbi:uncharacterized protein LOC143036476 isoform X1 [Oratosquilla oratoria]|uniref:uncharacterized protein LOC143036476 isoform X1 n=1 Tax=Oratosquilla oratoria TaxID=337810 RepID=UPI003F76027C
MASPAAMEWLHKRRDTVQPWTLFVNTSKFKVKGVQGCCGVQFDTTQGYGMGATGPKVNTG